MDNANFMAYFGIFIFIALIIGGVIYAQRMAQKEQELRLILAKSKRLLNRSEEVWDIIQHASNYVGDAEVIDGLLKYYAYILKQREGISPQQDTSALLAKAEAFKTQYTPSDPTAELNNDAEIKRCKATFSKIRKILKVAASKKIINGPSFIELDQKAKYKLLHLEVDAYEKLGDLAAGNNNPAVATNCYKYAKKILIESDITFNGKHERIRNITDKNQEMFGNIVKEKLENQEDKKTSNEFGLPDDLNVMQGKAFKKD